MSTSVARLIPSISECRQPYLLSNFDLVTESFTLMAGKRSSPFLAMSTNRCTPVVVSSVTPLISLAIDVQRPWSSARLRASAVKDDREFLGVGSGGVRHLAGLLELDALVHEEGGVAPVVQNHVGAALAGPQQGLLGAPPVLLEGFTLPGEDRHPLGILDRALRSDGHGGGGVVLGGEDVAAAPAHACTECGEGLDQHGRLDGHVQRAGDAGAGQWGWDSPNSARMAMSPASVSASSISLRPNVASDRSATLKGVG